MSSSADPQLVAGVPIELAELFEPGEKHLGCPKHGDMTTPFCPVCGAARVAYEFRKFRPEVDAAIKALDMHEAEKLTYQLSSEEGIGVFHVVPEISSDEDIGFNPREISTNLAIGIQLQKPWGRWDDPDKDKPYSLTLDDIAAALKQAEEKAAALGITGKPARLFLSKRWS